jgi:hypothetical protein
VWHFGRDKNCIGLSSIFSQYPRAFLIGAVASGLVLGATDRIIFFLPAALMALLVASVLIVRADFDVGFTPLTASVFSSGYLLGIVMANTRPRLFIRHMVANIAKLPELLKRAQ